MNNRQTVKPKIFLQALTIAALSVGLALVIFSPLRFADASNAVDFGAISPEAAAEDNAAAFGATQEISTKDAATKAAVKKGAWQNLMDNLKKFTWDKVLSELKKAGDVAWRKALKYYLNTMAYDMATYLATGDKGQLPMFETQGWGGYLKNVADNTAGTFIEQLGKAGLGGVKFNLCNPDFNVLLRINLGLYRSRRPKAPACTFSQMTKNWDTALHDKNFLPKFQDMFNPWSNDLGIALTLHTGIETEVSRDLNAAIKDREESGGFKSVTDIISGSIKTPGNLVREAAGVPLHDASASEKLYTGSILADSIDIFINTLLGKLVEKWLKGGLANNFPKLTDKLDSLTNFNAQNPAEGLAGAQDRMKSIVEPSFKVRADYDILVELATCPDPNKAGPTDCVIDDKFRQAIEKKMTVGQALKEGYLNGNGIFGFTADGLEPKFPAVYPYRSMPILRKYRIIPVGWEVAAQYIKDKQSIVGGAKNLKDLVDCFSGSDEYGAKGSVPAWCTGLVDPDWVLKAPQNFCAREGAGPEIISEQVTGEGSGSSLSVLRNDTYCADEQSVITEKSDGSPVYGYCTEERRKWDFNANACEPRSNTCQTFGSSAGQTNSYLENTLDFGVCNLGNVGCQKYAIAYSNVQTDMNTIYNSAEKSVDWHKSTQEVYLNRQAETCDSSSEGCQAFIRITPGSGETYDSIEGDGSATAVAAAYARFSASGLIHEKLMPDYLMSSCYSDAGDHYLPKDSAPAICSDFARKCKKEEIGCELYTSTASGNKIPAKTIAQDYCPAECVGYNVFIQSVTPFDSKRDAYFIPRTAKACGAEAAGCDEFTNLEQATTATPSVAENKEYYSSLRQCVKKSEAPPEGQKGSCGEFYTWEGSDESGFQLKVESLALDENSKPLLTAGAFTEVSNDSSECNQTIYNASVSDPSHNDDCRQLYSHAGTVFYALYSNTKTCSEDCHPYRLTSKNIFESVVGATGIERATNQCKTDCGSGSENQTCRDLCVDRPCTSADADQKKTCKQADDTAIYCRGGGLWSTDNGGCIYMAVPSQGVTCSAAQTGCREYTGNTGNNLRKIFTDDFGNGVGYWVGDSGSAANPSSEALTLDANNKGRSLQISIVNSQVGAIAKRPVGTMVHKGLDYTLSFVAKAASANSNLTVELSDDADHSQFFVASNASSLKLMAGAWRIFNVNLTGLNHEASANEILRLSADKIFYIDNITLTEITDRYYLIKDSWKTPDSCDENLDHGPESHYMLYCDQYTDRANKTQNLKQFNKLCQESAVGCELMIDTHNSSNPNASYYKDGNAGTLANADLTVPEDNPAYVVYDTEKFCGAEEKGCERLGQAYKYDTTTLYGDAYLKNNPDKYDQILCGAGSVGCDIFTFSNGTTDNGEKYFKDPGDQVCEWRRTAGAGASESWLKKKVKRCDDGPTKVNGKIDAGEINVCLSDSNCSIINAVKCSKDSDCRVNNNCLGGKCSVTGNSCNNTNDCAPLTKCVSGSCHYLCITDNNDYTCTTDEIKPKTLGLGGSNPIIQPAGNGWAGLCPAADSGCTEYIDPVSKFNSNLIFNGSFQPIAGNNWDGWKNNAQSVSLEPNTAYRLGRAANAGSLTISNCTGGGALYGINSDNSLDLIAQSQIAIISANSKVFYFKGGINNAAASCTIAAGGSGGAVELKKVAIDYQLRENLDSKSCNGQVNTGQGCVLFNERSQDGAGLKKLDYDADISAFSSPATDADKDSNIILKVAPDRVCDKWLACKSYIKDAKGNNVCFDVGLCDAVDGNGNCQSFIRSNKENQVAGPVEISNLSGYSKVGIVNGSLKTDYYPFGAMVQQGEVVNMPNGGFEYYGANLYPIGWTYGSGSGFSVSVTSPAYSGGATTTATSWNSNIFSVINNPIAAQTEGIGYAPEGAAFLKLGSSYDATSELVDVIPDTDYTITAYLNTKNLKSGQARIDVINGANATPNVISQDLGNDWQFQMGKFKTGVKVSQIKIKLYSLSDKDCNVNSDCTPGLCVNKYCSSSSEGNFYYDDIKIRPALNSRIKSGDCFPGYCVSSNGVNGTCSNVNRNCLVVNDILWYTPQSCRLYPQSDALACDYYEASGKRQKGWPGYCLEYDRRPGDPNTCLLWYPIDKVKGDGIEEGAGYAGKAPVYYSLEGKTERFVEYRHAFYYGRGRWDNCGNFLMNTGQTCGPNYDCVDWGISEKGGWDDVSIACIPNGKDLIISDGSIDAKTSTNPTSVNDGWYPYDGVQAFNSAVTIDSANALVQPNKFSKYLCDGADSCSLTKELFRTKLFSTKLVQTVTSVGQNKYWSSRVYEGSSYIVPNLGFVYGSDSTPFGSMVPPSPANNPYEWDGDRQKNFNQPIYYNIPDSGMARLGQAYNCIATELGDCKYVADVSAKDFYPYIYFDLSSTSNNNSVELVRRLFAQSYGVWVWDGSHYVPPLTNQDWGSPDTLCNATGISPRPVYNSANPNADLCAIPPTVSNIKINSVAAGNVNLVKNGFISLTFNTKVDSNQLPMVMYGVDWGDDSKTVVTGVEMRDKSNADQPETIYHLYSYWDLKAKANSGAPIHCLKPGECQVKPQIQIKDNWGWCSGGGTINDCSVWKEFGGWVVVKEK